MTSKVIHNRRRRVWYLPTRRDHVRALGGRRSRQQLTRSSFLFQKSRTPPSSRPLLKLRRRFARTQHQVVCSGTTPPVLRDHLLYHRHCIVSTGRHPCENFASNRHNFIAERLAMGLHRGFRVAGVLACLVLLSSQHLTFAEVLSPASAQQFPTATASPSPPPAPSTAGLVPGATSPSPAAVSPAVVQPSPAVVQPAPVVSPTPPVTSPQQPAATGAYLCCNCSLLHAYCASTAAQYCTSGLAVMSLRAGHG